ncbi:MAG: DUF4003 family protein [Candidatus Cohnella colombiensis]|uniref:DUF4003 family protein n=1 Tax=Candidatus Cohnella colombiensis TaxID=3121368 RepID=A0AA95EZS3_9BACL|nr:MAG: DUF4003 family protein [Cohnella sp.]
MKEQTLSRLDLFVANSQLMKSKFIWQPTLIKRLASLLYAAEDKAIDIDAIQESYELIKKNTGVFSSLRGSSAISISALLSLSEEKNEQLSNTLAIYDMMKEVNFRASDFLVVAAYQIAAHTLPENYSHTVNRAKAFYVGMKAEHRFITGQNDYIYAAMLGMSSLDINYGLTRIEQLYATFKPHFHSGDSVQALAQVLVLGEENRELEARVLSMRGAFRERNVKLDHVHTLSTLGVLSLLPAEIDSIVNGVLEVNEYLRTKKGFGIWSVTKQELSMYSATLIAYEYMSDMKIGLLTSTLSTSLTNIIIAQQAAIAAAVATSAAVNTSSN